MSKKEALFSAVWLLVTVSSSSCLHPSRRYIKEHMESFYADDSNGSENALLSPISKDGSSGEYPPEICKSTLTQIILRLEEVDEHCDDSIMSLFSDCCQLKFLGQYSSGVYAIAGELAYCDMETDGGGWMVIQRRVPKRASNNQPRSFAKNWRRYVNGFGVLDRNLWLGLERMHQLTAAMPMEMRVDLVKSNGERTFARYGTFYIAGEDNKYQLTVEDYDINSTTRDAFEWHNGMFFSTKDVNNDVLQELDPSLSCTHHCDGCFAGWWYNGAYGRCHDANLNWQNGTSYFGYWKESRQEPYTPLYTFVEMKIRPKLWHCGLKQKIPLQWQQ